MGRPMTAVQYSQELLRATAPIQVVALVMRRLRSLLRPGPVYLVSTRDSVDGLTERVFPGHDVFVSFEPPRNARLLRRVRDTLDLAAMALDRSASSDAYTSTELSPQELAVTMEEISGWPCLLKHPSGDGPLAQSPRWERGKGIPASATQSLNVNWYGQSYIAVFDLEGDQVAVGHRLEAVRQVIGLQVQQDTWHRTLRPSGFGGVGHALLSRSDPEDYLQSIRAVALTALRLLDLDAALVAVRQAGAASVLAAVGPVADSLQRYLETQGGVERFHRPALLGGMTVSGSEYSVLVRPITAAGRNLGALTVARRSRTFHGIDFDVLETLEVLLSQLIVSRLLKHELENRLQDLDLLWEITNLVAELKTPDRILDAVAHFCIRLGRADAVAVFAKGTNDTLEPLINYFADGHHKLESISVKALESLVRGAIVVSYRRGETGSYSLPGGLGALLEKYHLALFYLKADVPLGAVLLGREAGPFSGREMRLLTIVLRQVSMALRNAELFYAADHERALLRTLFEQASDGIMLVDGNLQVVGFNKAMEQITGWRADELIGRRCRDFMACRGSDGSPMCLDGCPALEAIWNHGQLPYVELHVVDREGRRKDLAVSFSYVPSPENPDLSYSLAIVRDVTEVRAAEQVRNQLVSAVSHELRTPLAALKASISLLRASLPGNVVEPSSPVVKLVENAERSVDRLTRIVEDSLDLARAQVGRLALKREGVDLVEVAAAVAGSLQPLASSKGQKIVLRGQGSPALVLGDRTRLEQTLTNLVSNAIKYGPENSEVEIIVGRKGPSVRLEILDKGPGVPPHEQMAIFEPFYRGTNVPREVKGSGLGLAVAKSLTELHGGRIWVRNRPNGGAAFVVELPALHPDFLQGSAASSDADESVASR